MAVAVKAGILNGWHHSQPCLLQDARVILAGKQSITPQVVPLVSKATAAHPPRKNKVFKQGRSKVTHDALIESGFALVDHKDIESISISELARHAGYSVGAFYAQFRSKDEFFDALIHYHLQRRTETQSKLVASEPLRELIDNLVTNIVRYYWQHHIFWRAVLRRTLRDSGEWAPFRTHFKESNERFNNRIEKEIGRKLDKRERDNITFAFQTVMGLINISIINQPGPVLIGQKQFVEELSRAFKLISEIDRLIAKK
jgi:AcrR family transcriptional regulator